MAGPDTDFEFGTPRRPVLLLGATGMLGRAWTELLKRRDTVVEAADRASIDITNPAAVAEAITGDHTLVINCAAYTDVDGAEAHEADARAVNADAVGLLAERCAATGARLVHYSTDYVFDGAGESPCRTDHPIAPINAYGRTKAEGEARLRDSGVDHLLVRTSWLYAPWSRNFVRTIARLAAERDELRVVNDQRGGPTSAEHLAAATLALIERGATGTFHVTDGGDCTWFDLAAAIVDRLGAACQVTPCTTAEMPRPATRPRYSVLDLSATEALLGPMPTWPDNLADVLERLE